MHGFFFKFLPKKFTKNTFQFFMFDVIAIDLML